MSQGVKVAVIGGGTGLSVLLRGLKRYTENISAIVTMSDNGGGSGVLREDLGMLPPGDLRNCILALSNVEPIMEKLLQYRFEEGALKGQSFGNLLIAAMDGISGSFEEAIERVNDIFAVTGRVFPATSGSIHLWGMLRNGEVVKGESELPRAAILQKSGIDKVWLEPKDAAPVTAAVQAIMEADIIVLGPGSLYTSVIPNLLIRELAEAVEASEAPKVYICNLMTQPGETDDYGVKEHVDAILRHGSNRMVDVVMVNCGSVPEDIQEKYRDEGAHLIMLGAQEREQLTQQGFTLICDDFVEIKSRYLRHDAEHLSQKLLGLVDARRYV